MLRFVILLFVTVLATPFLGANPSYASENNKEFYEWLYEQRRDWRAKHNDELPHFVVAYEEEFKEFVEENVFLKNVFLKIDKHVIGPWPSFSDRWYSHIGKPEGFYFNDDGTIFLDGCKPHYCDDKGFLWIDTKNDVQVFGILTNFSWSRRLQRDGILLLHSDDFESKETLPTNFWDELEYWHPFWGKEIFLNNQ